MRIEFDVGGTPAEFSWSSVTGRVELRVATIPSFWRAHFGSLGPTRPSERSRCGMAEMLNTLSSL